MGVGVCVCLHVCVVVGVSVGAFLNILKSPSKNAPKTVNRGCRTHGQRAKCGLRMVMTRIIISLGNYDHAEGKL